MELHSYREPVVEGQAAVEVLPVKQVPPPDGDLGATRPRAARASSGSARRSRGPDLSTSLKGAANRMQRSKWQQRLFAVLMIALGMLALVLASAYAELHTPAAEAKGRQVRSCSTICGRVAPSGRAR